MAGMRGLGESSGGVERTAGVVLVLSVVLAAGGAAFGAFVFVMRRTYFRGMASDAGDSAYRSAMDHAEGLAHDGAMATLSVFAAFVLAMGAVVMLRWAGKRRQPR